MICTIGRGWKNGLCLDITGENAKYYEADHMVGFGDRAMPDPWVMQDPEGEVLMYFTARAPNITGQTQAA